MLIRIVYRDPEHVAERLTLYGAERLGEPSREWAEAAQRERPDAHPATLAEELRLLSAKIARVDGAVSGTPFLIAMVPGYLNYLWQEGRMALRMAALFGHDPGSLDTAAEVLALRGIHPTVEAAKAALIVVSDSPAPERPERRRPLRTWGYSAYILLVFGGFLSPSNGTRREGTRDLLVAIGGVLLAGAIWVTTWVLPATFMIAMAWGCETHTRRLGRDAIALYGGDAESTRAAIAAASVKEDRGRGMRVALRSLAIFTSVAIPVAILVLAVHAQQSGLGWPTVIGALVALSLVFAAAVWSRR